MRPLRGEHLRSAVSVRSQYSVHRPTLWKVEPFRRPQPAHTKQATFPAAPLCLFPSLALTFPPPLVSFLIATVSRTLAALPHLALLASTEAFTIVV